MFNWIRNLFHKKPAKASTDRRTSDAFTGKDARGRPLHTPQMVGRAARPSPKPEREWSIQPRMPNDQRPSPSQAPPAPLAPLRIAPAAPVAPPQPYNGHVDPASDVSMILTTAALTSSASTYADCGGSSYSSYSDSSSSYDSGSSSSCSSDF